MTTPTALDVLKEARQRLANGSWHTGTLAKDANGRDTLTSDPQAVSFCALGAIHACQNKAEADSSWDVKLALRHAAYDAADLLADIIRPILAGQNDPDDGWELEGVADWNDLVAQSKDEVLAAFDEAIAANEPAEVPA